MQSDDEKSISTHSTDSEEQDDNLEELISTSEEDDDNDADDEEEMEPTTPALQTQQQIITEEAESNNLLDEPPFQQRLVSKYIRDHIAYHTETQFHASQKELNSIQQYVTKPSASTTFSLLSLIVKLITQYFNIDPSTNKWFTWLQSMLGITTSGNTSDKFLRDYLALESYRNQFAKFQTISHPNTRNMLLPNYQYDMLAEEEVTSKQRRVAD